MHDLSPEFDALIDRALEPDPDKRLSTPGEFWNRLDAISDRPSRGLAA